MSLKALHVCFIVLSIVLCAGIGAWAGQQPSDSGRFIQFLRPASYFLAGALALYLFFFLAKMKKVKPS